MKYFLGIASFILSYFVIGLFSNEQSELQLCIVWWLPLVASLIGQSNQNISGRTAGVGGAGGALSSAPPPAARKTPRGVATGKKSIDVQSIANLLISPNRLVQNPSEKKIDRQLLRLGTTDNDIADSLRKLIESMSGNRRPLNRSLF